MLTLFIGESLLIAKNSKPPQISVPPGSLLPHEIALARLRERVEADETLPAPVKEAFIADLVGNDPAALTHLESALMRETEKHEADEAKGT